jgi:hypothetical protein
MINWSTPAKQSIKASSISPTQDYPQGIILLGYTDYCSWILCQALPLFLGSPSGPFLTRVSFPERSPEAAVKMQAVSFSFSAQSRISTLGVKCPKFSQVSESFLLTIEGRAFDNRSFVLSGTEPWFAAESFPKSSLGMYWLSLTSPRMPFARRFYPGTSFTLDGFGQ